MHLLKKGFIFFTILFTISQTLLISLDKHHITVGYQKNSDLVIDLENKGDEGIGYELLKKIEYDCNLQFEFIEIKGDAFDALRNNEVDIIGLFLKSPQRESEFLYSANPFNTIISCLATKNPQGIYYDDPQSIDGKTVATYEGNPTNELLDKYLVENNISVTYVIGTLENYLELETDFYLTFTENRSNTTFYTVLNLANSDTFLLANLEDTALMDEIDKAYSKMKIAEGFFYNELLVKYNFEAVNLSHRELTRTEVETLRERTLKIGYFDDHRPYTYTDKDGNPNGAIIDLMKVLAKKYSFDIELIPYNMENEDYDYSSFDMIISLIGNTNYVLDYYIPTEAYYRMPLVATLPKSFSPSESTVSDILEKTATIGISEYLYVDFDAFINAAGDTEFVFYNSFEKLIDSYKNNFIDIAVYTSAASSYVDAYLEGTEHPLFPADFTLGCYFSISKPLAKDYMPIFNIMLDTITEREYENIFNEHFTSFYPSLTLKNFFSKYWMYFFSFALALILFFLYYYYRVQDQKNELQIQAYRTDKLTGLMSLSYYYEKSSEILLSAKPHEYELISFDIDYFRTINSYYSMERGTAVISKIGKTLLSVFKGTPALFVRKTAEQFYILRKIGTGPSVQELYKIYILPVIQSVIGNRYDTSMSFGTVSIENCEEKISNITAYADYARMSGKVSHETTFITFDKNMKKSFTSKLEITFKMERAIKDKEFKVVYQPKIDFQTLKIVGAEALVRWIPPMNDVIYPNEFIEVFERNGFIFTLDLYVLKEVCQFIHTNRQKMEVPIISVNLSAITILEDSLLPQLMKTLSIFDIKPNQIDLEITETAILGSENKFMSKIEELKAAGFIVSLDDFGSGVSSLNRLGYIKADVLKIDKDFFDKKELNARTAIIVDQVITLAKRLDMKIVAEGVETYEQALWLKGLKCDVAQGYYFSKPVDEESFIQSLIDNKAYNLEPQKGTKH